MKYVIFLLGFAVLMACSTSKQVGQVVYVDSKKFDVGSSGMAQIDSNSYMAVYDLKSFEEGVRLGLIKTYRDSIRVFPILVDDWKSEEIIPSDLEGITAIPGRELEFLICESGNWQGKLGRIFHIKVDLQIRSASVLGVVQIPIKHRNDFNLVGDQYEGIICLEGSANKFNIILAERGGSDAYPDGVVKWGILDLNNSTFTFSKEGGEGIVVSSPGSWKSEQNKRDLTDFYVDDQRQVWASASQDMSDSGPFHSVIYKVGKISASSNKPFKLATSLQVYKEFPSYKIEALSGPSSAVPGSSFAFGTEDEIYGGTWRPVE